MQKARFLTLMTTALALGSSQNATDALSGWADKHLPALSADAQALLSGPFSFGEIGKLAEAAVEAAQDLKGVIAGTDRGRLAQAVLVMSVRAVLPDDQEHWVVPLLDSDVAAGLIQAAFLKLFGKAQEQEAGAVVDALELPEGSVE